MTRIRRVLLYSGCPALTKEFVRKGHRGVIIHLERATLVGARRH